MAHEGPSPVRGASPRATRPTLGRVLGRRIGLVLAVLGAGVAAGAAPASGELRSPGCLPAGGLFSGAAHPGTCWRPFAPTSPFNVRLQPKDPRVQADSSRIVARLNDFGEPGNLSFGRGESGKGFGQKAVYFARPSDPLVRIRLRNDDRNGGTWGRSELEGSSIRVPAGAEPSQGVDGHIAVVDQATGWVSELWETDEVVRGGVLSASWGGRTRIDGSGETLGTGVASASGLSILGGIIRPEELLQGEIPHALYLTVNCTSGRSVGPSLRPSVDPENACSRQGKPDTDAPALGQRFQLGYTEAQIDGLRAPAHAKVLLRAMARYGMIVMDVTGGDAWHLDSEASIDRLALGRPDPGVTFARRAGLPSYDGGRQYLWQLAGIPGVDGRPGSWTTALRVLKPCVSDGSCPAQARAVSSADAGAPKDGFRRTTSRTVVARSGVVRSSVTIAATTSVTSPAAARATATATGTATARIRPTSSGPAARRRARTAARTRARAAATRRAKVRSLARARGLATDRARRIDAIRRSAEAARG